VKRGEVITLAPDNFPKSGPTVVAALFIGAGVEGSRVNGKSESKSQLDLLEIRRQFIELRSLHSNNERVASR
jgi:hypothetical protein